ncbi:collagenase [Pseudoalteromonas xiamenensis]|uniref:collagenase n=1 Tax=Pseudoalteromonas xiamenensis TaxID=882626 RepID=UPI0027E4BAF2|nr:collagenase [Pseudoalteromonas xiamenensis]WMN60639.1 collagenase [Pseudoalteromonas xiamenensis]
MNNKKWLLLSVSLALSACGDNDKPVTVVEVVTPNPDPVVTTPEPSFPFVDDPILTLDSVKTGIETISPIGYYLDLDTTAPALIISLGSGTQGLPLGDPDVYVKFEGLPEAGDNPVFDCVSFNGSDNNETCIIDNPKPGRYTILIDAYEGGKVSDATLFATTSLFKSSELCNDMVRVRIQEALDENTREQICQTLIETKSRFEAVLNADRSADVGVPVPNDLNDITNINIFASLSNHMSWVEHLWDSNNRSGIYFETAPDKWYHDSTILTFNAVEWSEGRPVMRSLAHEYVHALDGRFNKEGGYHGQIGWWSEGLAEYIGTYYERPYQMLFDASQPTKHTLSEITTPTIDSSSFYDWGTLAVAYLIESHPDKVKSLITNMRAGNWETVASDLETFSSAYQADFETWQSTQLVNAFNASAEPLPLNVAKQVNGRGGWLFKVTVPSQTPSLTIETSGGSKNVDLWVNQGTPAHPSLTNDMTCHSVTEKSNEEKCVILNPIIGDYYVTVGSDFAGADIMDLYITACVGDNCSVSKPEPIVTVTPTEPYLPHWPEKGQLGTCSLLESYGRSTAKVEGFTLQNTSDKALNLYWIDYRNGTKPTAAFQTLPAGETFSSDAWRIGDRMMIGDLANNCLGVAIVNDTQNHFIADSEFAANAVDEAPIPVATAEIGRCDLLTSYSRESGNAPEFVIHNQSDTPVTLAWINNNDGSLYYGTYGTLNLGDHYANTNWRVGDRMALMSNDGQCYGVVDLNAQSNIYVIDSSLFN